MPRVSALEPLLLLLSTIALGCAGADPQAPTPDAGVVADAGVAPEPACSDPCGDACCGAGQVCIGGVCADRCVPSCDGKACGDDGCGGTCGSCGDGASCNASQCVATCVPSCDGKACGDDGCGGTCGSCGDGASCNAGQCVATCVPSCDGKQCGDDGCGGTCGSCGDGTSCNAGQCVASCVPSCSGKQCGDDGCGGTCGGCAGDLTCGGAGVPFQCGMPVGGCSADDWCVVDSGTTAFLPAVWGASADEVYAISLEDSTLATELLKWNGTTWSAAPGGQIASLTVSLHGSGAGDVWLAGAANDDSSDGALIHYDGTGVTSASALSNGFVAGVHVVSESAAFAVGTQFDFVFDSMLGFVAKWDGATWTTLSPPTAVGQLFAVWANGAADLWVAGDYGQVMRFEAGAWKWYSAGAATTLKRAWGSGPNDVWFIGDAGIAAHWNGTQLSVVDTHVTVDLHGIWGTSANDVWVVGDEGTLLHWNGTAFEQKSSGISTRLTGVWAASPADAWAVGDGGRILRYRP